MIDDYSATDINPDAIEATLATAKLNNVTGVKVILCDLVDGVKQMLRRKVDLLVTNPPFEPSEDEKVPQR